MIKVNKKDQPRICQGDIFRDVEYLEYISENAGFIEVSKIVFPLVIVLTQDCDLEQDYRFRSSSDENSSQDKWLLTVLVAPLYNAEHVFLGEHLQEIDRNMGAIPKGSQRDNLRTNQRPRYHYLEFPNEVQISTSVIDFKHYFSVDVQYLRRIKKTNCICAVDALYREDVSQRFASFLSRIGLP